MTSFLGSHGMSVAPARSSDNRLIINANQRSVWQQTMRHSKDFNRNDK